MIDCPGAVENGSGTQNSNRNTVNISDKGLVMFALALSVLAIGISGWAIASKQYLDNRMLGVMTEKRLLQEDLIMLRAALRAHGVDVETAGDHE